MQPTEIKTGKATILVVKVPEGAQDISVCKVIGDELYYHNKHHGKVTINLPPGNWKELGFSHELTEDQWKEIVERWNDSKKLWWKDYEYIGSKMWTATESGRSLLIANRFFDKNPYGEKPILDFYDENKEGYMEDFSRDKKEWQEAQERTGRFIILIEQS